MELTSVFSHPKILFFHLFFRTLALVLYIVSSFVTSETILFAALVIICLAFDFWTVKNVSGRLLVGLRWWNDSANASPESGTNWVFESKDRELINKMDSRIFWMSLYAYSLIWGIFLVIAIIRFSFLWAVIVCVALTLNSANVVGFTKCDKDAKKKLTGLVQTGLMSGLMSNTLGKWVG